MKRILYRWNSNGEELQKREIQGQRLTKLQENDVYR